MAMILATLLHELLAGFGCASITLLGFAIFLMLLGVRLGWFPIVNRLLERLERGPDNPPASPNGVTENTRNST
jgi:hypothetical protein